MGPDPDVRGYYHCCGFNSSGIMLGGGCGNQIAKWIVNGQPDLDMFGFDIRYLNLTMIMLFVDPTKEQQAQLHAYSSMS